MLHLLREFKYFQSNSDKWNFIFVAVYVEMLVSYYMRVTPASFPFVFKYFQQVWIKLYGEWCLHPITVTSVFNKSLHGTFCLRIPRQLTSRWFAT